MSRGFRFDLGVAQFSEYDGDRFLGVQIDAFGEADSGLPPFEVHHAYGFAARPLDPDDDGTGCAVLYAVQGNEGHAWLASDPRSAQAIPDLEKGASVQYSAAGAWNLLEADGSYQLYVPFDLDADGVPQKAHTIRVDTEQNSITILHANGQAIVLGSDGAITLACDDDTSIIMTPGEITLGAAKIVLNGTVFIGNPTLGAPLLAGPASPPCPRLFVSPAL